MRPLTPVAAVFSAGRAITCDRGNIICLRTPVWLNEYETLDDARQGIGGYVDRYHHRPHSGLDYLTPFEVRQTWEDLQRQTA